MKFFKIAALFTALAASMPAQRFGPRANGGSLFSSAATRRSACWGYGRPGSKSPRIFSGSGCICATSTAIFAFSAATFWRAFR